VSSRTPWAWEPGSGTGAFGRGEPEVVVLDDATALAGAAADRIGAGLRAAVAAHAAAHFALTDRHVSRAGRTDGHPVAGGAPVVGR